MTLDLPEPASPNVRRLAQQFPVSARYLDAPVTSLPGAPQDNQLVVYTADATNGVDWLLHYRASTAKWHFLGGPPMFATIGDEGLGLTTGSWIDAPTVGPKITVPIAGDYNIRGLAEWRRAGGALDGFLGISKGATNASIQEGVSTSAATVHSTVPIEGALTSVTAATDVRLRYFQGTGASCNVANRWIFVTPIRIA